MRFEVIAKRLEYDIEFHGKYSVIQGDSGSGKTNLCRLLHDRQIGDRTIKINSEVPVLTLDAASDGEELQTYHGNIIVLDEYYNVLERGDLPSLLRRSDNYFIIITRKVMDFLPLCVESIYSMANTGKKHWIVPMFQERTLTLEETGYSFESLESAATSVLQSVIQYSKEVLPKCLLPESNCNACRNVSDCKVKHHEFKPDLVIRAEE